MLRFCVSLLRLKSSELILDGMRWPPGKKQPHFLVLSVIYQGIAIRIYWEDLRKKGIGNQKERKRVLKKAMKPFDLQEMTLLAAREYMGYEWFKFLGSHQIDFSMRLKYKTYSSF